MRIRVVEFMSLYVALIMGMCGSMCWWGTIFVSGSLDARLVMLLFSIGMTGVCVYGAHNGIEIDWEKAPRQEPPRKEPEVRPEVAPVKRDRYEMIKVGVT